MTKLAISLFCGVLFGAGLTISGMASPQVVRAFLALGPGWNPALMFVMGGALLITVPGFWWLRTRERSLLGEPFSAPASNRIDRRLVGGAVLFGIGWGLAGYCPGPAVVGFGMGQLAALVFLPAMMVGAAVANRLG